METPQVTLNKLTGEHSVKVKASTPEPNTQQPCSPTHEWETIPPAISLFIYSSQIIITAFTCLQ